MELPDWFQKAVKRSGPSTTLNTDGVTKEIASVIKAWDEGNLSAALPVPFPMNAPAAVRFIRDHLGLALPEVTEAVRITEKSYYNWANKGHKPQQNKLGILWPMTHAIYSLVCANLNLAAWFHSSSEAREAFAAGDINRLLSAEMDWAVRAARVEPRPVPYFDEELPEPSEAPAPRRRRVSDVSEPATRRRRVSTP